MTTEGLDGLFTPAEAAAWGGFLSTFGRLNTQLEEDLKRTAGISRAEYEVLLRLSMEDEGRLRIQALSERSIMSHSGMSRLVDRLAGAGLVERSPAEEDGRGAYAVITDAGRSHFVEAAQRHTARVRDLFLRHFSPEELELMGAFWERVRASEHSPEEPAE